ASLFFHVLLLLVSSVMDPFHGRATFLPIGKHCGAKFQPALVSPCPAFLIGRLTSVAFFARLINTRRRITRNSSSAGSNSARSVRFFAFTVTSPKPKCGITAQKCRGSYPS